ncbi:MAG: alpha/beta hydrolase [Gammaproteobacteria bacterium]
MPKLLDAIELETGKNPSASVIWMHGLGADGSDFVPIVHDLGLDAALALRFVFPHAPMRPVTINGGAVMRAWYDVSFGDLEGKSRRSDEGGIRESQQQINALIEREGKRGVGASRIVLAGFSQGGAIALQTGLRHPEKLAGVMALSAYLPFADSLPQEAAAANKGTPIFMAHGLYDPVVPLMMGASSMTFLAGLGYSIEWRQYPMPHAVCPQEIADIGAWLRKILNA